jgi:hypothetical protein
MLNCYCQLSSSQLFLDNMVLANQNAKLTGPDQGFLVSRLVLTLKPWERGCVYTCILNVLESVIGDRTNNLCVVIPAMQPIL